MKPTKNVNGNYQVEEVIHHGDYYKVRVVEVYDFTPLTIEGILISSAYSYTGIGEQYKAELLEDLKAGRENRTIGWSTFRVL